MCRKNRALFVASPVCTNRKSLTNSITQSSSCVSASQGLHLYTSLVVLSVHRIDPLLEWKYHQYWPHTMTYKVRSKVSGETPSTRSSIESRKSNAYWRVHNYILSRSFAEVAECALCVGSVISVLMRCNDLRECFECDKFEGSSHLTTVAQMVPQR
jgi:hypothetical protein